MSAVRVRHRPPRFALSGYAWRNHEENDRAKRVRRSWSAAKAKTDWLGGNSIWYVYIIRSVANPEQEYVGASEYLKTRVADHNAGKSTHTAKYVPWELLWYCAFPDKHKALEFERYLKSHSGRAFSKKRLI
jgi:putative endonuclease